MVMQARYVTTYGKRTFTDSANPWSNYQINQPAKLEFLHSILSVSGSSKVPHPQRFTKVTTSESRGVVRTFYPDGNYQLLEGYVGHPVAGSIPALNDAAAYNQLIDKLYERVRGGLDLSVDIAEGHKTWDMLKSASRSVGLSGIHPSFRGPVPRVMRVLESLERIARQYLKNPRSKDYANAWLAWTYGWKPAATSLYEAVDKMMTPQETVIRVRVTSSAKDKLSTRTPVFHPYIQSDRIGQSQVRYLLDGWFRIQDSTLLSLAGYTSLNPVSIAWELVPYSFVVDWVVDIGGYMRNLESALLYRSSWKGGFITKGTIERISVATHGSYSYPDGRVDQMGVFGESKTTSKVRTVLSAEDVPFPQRPSFNVSLGTNRLLSAASLLRQRI